MYKASLLFQIWSLSSLCRNPNAQTGLPLPSRRPPSQSRSAAKIPSMTYSVRWVLTWISCRRGRRRPDRCRHRSRWCKNRYRGLRRRRHLQPCRRDLSSTIEYPRGEVLSVWRSVACSDQNVFLARLEMDTTRDHWRRLPDAFFGWLFEQTLSLLQLHLTVVIDGWFIANSDLKKQTKHS